MTSAVPLISSQPLPEAVGVPVHNLDAVLLGQLEVHGVALGGADLRLADLDLNNCTVYTDCTNKPVCKASHLLLDLLDLGHDDALLGGDVLTGDPDHLQGLVLADLHKIHCTTVH